MGYLGAWTWLVLSRTRFTHQNHWHVTHCTQDSETEGVFCTYFVIFFVTILSSNFKIFSVGAVFPTGCSAFFLLLLSCFSMPIWFSWWPPSESKIVSAVDSVENWTAPFFQLKPPHTPPFPALQPSQALVLSSQRDATILPLCPFKLYLLHKISSFAFLAWWENVRRLMRWIIWLCTGTGSWWGLGKCVLTVMSHSPFKKSITLAVL